MKEFDTAIFESGDIVRRGVRLVVENVGRAIAIITVLVTALVLFCDVGFADVGAEKFTSTLIIMLISSYLMYFSCYETGEESGRGSEEYKTKEAEYKKLRERITCSHLEPLRSYLKSYSENEAKYRRVAILMQNGYSYDEYEAYKSGEKFDRKAVKAFKKADSIKATPIPTSTLVCGMREKRRSEIQDPDAHKIFGSILKLLPMTVCSIFTVSVILTAKDGLGAIDVIEGIFKLSSLLIIGLRGHLAGMTYSMITLPSWIETKCRLLDDFLKSFKESEADTSKTVATANGEYITSPT